MARSDQDVPKMKRGPAYRGGRKSPQLVRMEDALIATIDDWRKMQDDEPSRPEAIRRLVELGLSYPSNARARVLSTSKQSAARAAELAAKAIDEQIDPKAPHDEREVRKRKLVDGPSAFRNTRKDRRVR